MAKSTSNLIDLSDLDPAVGAALGRGDRRQADLRQPRAERQRQAKQREKTAARRRFNMDIEPDLDRRLSDLANRLSCPASGLANLAIALMLDQVDQGLDLSPYLAPSKSPRYERVVEIHELSP